MWLTLRKPQAFCAEMSFHLVYKTRTFLLSACQKLLQVGVLPQLGRWPKSWKVVRQLVNIYDYAYRKNTSQSPKTSESELCTAHLTGQFQALLIQKQQYNRLPQTKNSFKPLQLMSSHSTKPVTRI